MHTTEYIKNILNVLVGCIGLIRRLSHINIRTVSLLLIIPVILLFISFSLKNWAGPYWVGSNFDPEYAYLLSSLNITQLHLPVYTDHPGIPLQFIGAGVVAIAHIINNTNNLVDSVLLNPEYYLNSINILLVILIVTSILMVGVMVYNLTHKLSYALTIQATPLFSFTLLRSLNRVNPEPLLLLVGIWYSFSIIYLFFYKYKYKLRHVAILSMLLGFMLAIKINAFPLLFLPLVIFKGRQKIVFLISSFFGFILFTFPMYNSYEHFAKWLFNLFVHSGIYGTGPTSIINPESFISNFFSIIKSENILMLVLPFLMLFILTQIVSTQHNSIYKINFTVGIILIYLIQVSTVSKHYSAHYLVPCLSLIGASIVIILFNITYLNLKIMKPVTIIVLVYMIFISAQHLFNLLNYKNTISKTRSDSIIMNSLMFSDYKEYTPVYYYRASSKEFALNFGDGYISNFYYGRRLSRLYPSTYFYNIWDDNYYNWEGPTTMPEGEKILFQGSFNNLKKEIIDNPTFKEVYRGHEEGLYTVN